MGLFDFLNEVDAGNLAADAKWNIIQAGIEIAISEDMSMTATASELRAGGLRFTDAPFRDLFRELSGYRNQFDYVTKLGFDVLPNPSLMADAKFPLEGDYGYVGQVWKLNEETGFLTQRTFRYDSDELLSRSEAMQALDEYFQKYPEEFDDIIGEIEYIGAIVNQE